ncbi:kinetochore Sim4 complex subunit FTA2-domain-containing protein [Nemania sp. FL0916]|nr:kinetochore Sim4 complex subunit FTA2-domain-containing protein [Nemania sp. FL0916]
MEEKTSKHIARQKAKQKGKALCSSLAPALLPPCAGPKLHPFEPQNASIKWGQRLDKPSDNKNHGYVFEVEIASRPYAIKVFKFYHPASEKHYWEGYLGDSYPLEDVIFYTDPFYAECRAYGKINDAIEAKELRVDIATRCHGYIYLSKKDAMRLEKDSGIDLCTNIIDDDLLRALGGETRVRAIVKDLETADVGVNDDNVGRASRSVNLLNSLKIYNRGICAENFIDGRIVDFGSSWTEPHVILDSADADEANEQRLGDRAKFNDMIEKEGIEKDLKTSAASRHVLRPGKM